MSLDFPTLVVAGVLLLFSLTMIFHDYEADHPYYSKENEEKARQKIAEQKMEKKLKRNARFKF